MNKTNDDFIASLVPGAKAANVTYGVPASVTIAQAILESGWGHSGLAQKACNLFGIKADKRWKGERILMPTAEVIKGVRTMINAPFRKYKTLADSITDRAIFLHVNKRYKHAFECKTGCEFAVAIARAGWATDESYADKLEGLIKQHDLEKYDC